MELFRLKILIKKAEDFKKLIDDLFSYGKCLKKEMPLEYISSINY